MQYLMPVVCFGPSGKTCPKCPPQLVQVTSMRLMPRDKSSVSVKAVSLIVLSKLGQPQPEWYLLSLSNNLALQPLQR